MKIAIDCDGVLANFVEAAVREINKLWPDKHLTYDGVTSPSEWDFINHDEQSKLWAHIKESHNWWYYVKPYPESVTALSNFVANHIDNDIYIVTSRVPTDGRTTALQTKCWFEHYVTPPQHSFMGVIVVADASKKAGIYRALDITMSIDDKQETVAQCNQMKGEHQAFLLDRPWNQGSTEPRVKSLAEFLAKVHAQQAL